jgi:hypothetical protein
MLDQGFYCAQVGGASALNLSFLGLESVTVAIYEDMSNSLSEEFI